MQENNSYNQKLFSGGFRTRLHNLRFEWLRSHISEQAGQYSLFELGCFDARSLNFLQQPSRYLGADAGVENGLQLAQKKFESLSWADAVQSLNAQSLQAYENESFDYSIALETLEHVPPEVLPGYIAFMAKVTKKRLLVSVPVEVGPVFLAKHTAKNLSPSWRGGEEYKFSEILWATLGKVEHVERHEHKGFDYRALVRLINQYFEVVAIEGIPFKQLPYLSFQVGIVAKPKD